MQGMRAEMLGSQNQQRGLLGARDHEYRSLYPQLFSQHSLGLNLRGPWVADGAPWTPG